MLTIMQVLMSLLMNFLDVIKVDDNDNELNDNLSNSNNQQVMSINTNLVSEWSVNIDIQGEQVEFKIETGSQVNILPNSIYKRLCPRPKLKHTSITLSAYNNIKIPVIGKCVCLIPQNKKAVPVLFIVTEENLSPILGLPTSDKFQLIKRVSQVNNSNDILSEFLDCFGEIGCLPRTYHIELKPEIKPVITPPRKIPHSIKPKLKEELQRMERTRRYAYRLGKFNGSYRKGEW